MPAVLYLNAIPKADIEAYEGYIEALARGELLPGAKPEKLKTDHRIYSIRVGGKQRIIYAYYVYCGEQHILVLDIDKNHKYDSSFLDKGFFKNFIRSNKEALNQEVELLKTAHEDNVGNASKKSHKKKYDFTPMQLFDGEIFQLDDTQCRVSSRMVVQGGPGTGKSSLAEHYLELGAHNDENVLYITQSSTLVANMRTSWQESPAFDSENEKIELLTYDQLIQKRNGNNQIISHAREPFNTWFSDYLAKKKKTPEKFNEEAVYQEFRIRSGYTPIAYLDETETGKKQTTFYGEDRTWIDDAYQEWMRFCDQNNLRFAEFHSIEHGDEGKKYARILVDEAQDFSHKQLLEIYRLTDNGDVIFFIDSVQSLHDNKPKVIYLKKILGKDGQDISLETSYRCAPNIMKFAVAVSNIRKSVAQEKEKSTSKTTIPEGNYGEITWQEVDENSIDKITQTYGKNHDSCVITDEENKARFRAKKFSQVFTPEEIKGLQFKRVILYRITEQDGFANISKAISDNGNIDPNKTRLEFAAPLSKLFVGITRAREHLHIWHHNTHRSKNLVKLLRGACAMSTEAKPAQIKETSVDDWLHAAEKLYRNGNIEHATSVLQDNCGLSQLQISTQFLLWNPEEVPTKSVAAPSNTNADAVLTPDTHNAIYKTNDIAAIWKAMDPDGNQIKNIDWNHVSPDKKTALSIACTNTSKKPQGKAQKIVDYLINHTDVAVGPLRKQKIFAFKSALLLKKNNTVTIFLSAKRFDLEDYFDIITDSSDSEKKNHH